MKQEFSLLKLIGSTWFVKFINYWEHWEILYFLGSTLINNNKFSRWRTGETVQVSTYMFASFEKIFLDVTCGPMWFHFYRHLFHEINLVWDAKWSRNKNNIARNHQSCAS